MPDTVPAAGEYPDGITVDCVDKNGAVLNDKSANLATRFRALFMLRNLKDDRSVYWVGRALDDESALLKHELAYCLGQMQNKSALPILVRTLEDVNQEPMVRHEAGEALGAIADESSIAVLEKYCKDPVVEVAETCQLALKRARWSLEGGKNTSTTYNSVDPTPAAEIEDVHQLQHMLTNESGTLWDRYRAMFKLRNMNTDESIKALAQGLYCEDSALFRHEVAYVLGQIQSPLAIKELGDRLQKDNENCMVRHECAEALGAIATPECEKLLKQYVSDEERVVRESCIVALDMAEYESSEQFQYTTV